MPLQSSNFTIKKLANITFALQMKTLLKYELYDTSV